MDSFNICTTIQEATCIAIQLLRCGLLRLELQAVAQVRGTPLVQRLLIPTKPQWAIADGSMWFLLVQAPITMSWQTLAMDYTSFSQAPLYRARGPQLGRRQDLGLRDTTSTTLLIMTTPLWVLYLQRLMAARLSMRHPRQDASIHLT
jgi:hypothetical protein